MLKYLESLDSFEDFKKIVELEENTTIRSLFESIDFDDVVSSFIDLSNEYNYQHGVIDYEELENYLMRKALESEEPYTTVFKQAQNIKLFNESYYYINGYDNLENLEVSRLNAELFDLKQNVIEVLKMDIEEFIQNHFEYSRKPLILSKDKKINFNDVNYSIDKIDNYHKDSKVIVYGANIDNIMSVLIANLETDIITNLSKKSI